ncbi:MAG: hypothetical protein ACXWLM_00925 [Myxococcales bacterium]
MKLSDAALLALVALAPACRKEEVTHFRVSKRTEAAPARAAPAAMSGEVAPPPAPATALRWTLPKGWKATMVGGMRYATLTPPVAGRIDVSVVVLPGPAGGELANVNRWRGQLGLGAIDEPALASARQPIRTRAGPLSLYDFTSEGEKKSRMVAGLALIDGNSWFVKMVGDAGPVAAARADFIHILESLHLEPD